MIGPTRAWGSNHRPSFEAPVTTCLGLDLPKTDALD